MSDSTVSLKQLNVAVVSLTELTRLALTNMIIGMTFDVEGQRALLSHVYADVPDNGNRIEGFNTVAFCATTSDNALATCVLKIETKGIALPSELAYQTFQHPSVCVSRKTISGAQLVSHGPYIAVVAQSNGTAKCATVDEVRGMGLMFPNIIELGVESCLNGTNVLKPKLHPKTVGVMGSSDTMVVRLPKSYLDSFPAYMETFSGPFNLDPTKTPERAILERMHKEDKYLNRRGGIIAKLLADNASIISLHTLREVKTMADVDKFDFYFTTTSLSSLVGKANEASFKEAIKRCHTSGTTDPIALFETIRCDPKWADKFTFDCVSDAWATKPDDSDTFCKFIGDTRAVFVGWATPNFEPSFGVTGSAGVDTQTALNELRALFLALETGHVACFADQKELEDTFRSLCVPVGTNMQPLIEIRDMGENFATKCKRTDALGKAITLATGGNTTFDKDMLLRGYTVCMRGETLDKYGTLLTIVDEAGDLLQHNVDGTTETTQVSHLDGVGVIWNMLLVLGVYSGHLEYANTFGELFRAR